MGVEIIEDSQEGNLGKTFKHWNVFHFNPAIPSLEISAPEMLLYVHIDTSDNNYNNDYSRLSTSVLLDEVEELYICGRA